MTAPKVSVIVPVFNVRTYLSECLDSILAQTLSEIEIICGDGGSTDGSLEIIKEYAQKDGRIRYISKEKSGYGQSVNECMDLAHGEYIGIVESDDLIDPNTYDVLYGLAHHKDLDWVRGDIYYYYSGLPKDQQLKRESIIYGGDFYNVVLNPQTDYRPYKSGLRTWSGIYKTAFLRKYDIRHNETPGGAYQDVGFYLKTLYYAKRVYFVNEAFYKWRQDNPGSSIHYNSAKLVEKSLNEWHLNQQYLDEHHDIGMRAKASYNYRKFFSYLWTIDMADDEDKLAVQKQAAKEFNKALDNGEIDKGFFEENEWELFIKELKKWRSAGQHRGGFIAFCCSPASAGNSVKKLLKKVLHPLACVAKKLTYKLMGNVISSIRQDIADIEQKIDVIEQKAVAIEQKADAVERKAVAIEQKADVIEQKAVAIEQMADAIRHKAIDIEQKTIRIEQQAAAIEQKSSFIEQTTAVVKQKVLDQGDVLWNTRDKVKDVEAQVRHNADALIWNIMFELKRENMQKLVGTSPLYDSAFYLNNRYGSITSAQHILSVMFHKLPHKSVVDFGCGTGTWLWVAKILGAEDVYGVDGDYVPRSLLLIDLHDFLPADLERPIVLDRRYDLAMSLEVAEHLAESAADIFIDSLCAAADVILFSAAHPGQGGDGHINEQPRAYWIEKFKRHNFYLEEIKSLFIDDMKIEPWYRENIMLFRRQK